MRMLLAFLLLTSLATRTVHAVTLEQTAAVLRTGVEERAWDTDGPFTLGFRFRVNQAILVTSFGVFDHEGDGLNVPHPIQLWSATGTPLQSVTIPAGATGQLMDRFRWVPIQPLLLPANAEFMVAAANFGQGADHYLATAAVPQSSSRITLDNSYEAYTPNGSLVFPARVSAFYGSPAWFGPNFKFTAVPEPSNLLLIAIAMIECRTAVVRPRRSSHF
jgi:hypothetical protein